MKQITDTIQVNRHIDDVFDFMTDISNVETMFENIVNVAPVQAGGLTESRKFHQTRLVHGRQSHEIVEVIELERNTKYSIRTSVFGVETVYTYTLEPMSDTCTLVRLTKEARGKGFGKLLLPIISHLLTRPEHDGNHLHVLKAAVERHE